MELDEQAVGSGDSTESAEPTGQENRQPEERRINLDELPEFRKWKSETDRKMSQLSRQAQEAAYHAEQLRRQREQEMMAGMDEVERWKYTATTYEKRLQEIEQQRQYEKMAWQKDRDIAEVAADLGLDRAELEEALPADVDSFSIWKIGRGIQAKKGKPSPEREAAREATERVHVSTGNSPKRNKWEVMAEEAKASGDVGKLLDAMAGAAREGIMI
jgi:HD superfamily phosphohydrolase